MGGSHFSDWLDHAGRWEDMLRQSYLINPETSFASADLTLAGITSYSIQNAPAFDLVWNDIHSYFEFSLVIGYNARNDLIIPMRTLSCYHLRFSAIQYADIYEKAKNTFDLNHYFLDTVASECGYAMTFHNDVLDACQAIYEAIRKKDSGMKLIIIHAGFQAMKATAVRPAI